MATKGRRSDAPLIEELYDAPHRFGFFQAVRVLERHAESRVAHDSAPECREVGTDGAPSEEVVWFRASAEARFPTAEVAAIAGAKSVPTPFGDVAQPPHMTVAFLGLTGPSGVLPDHYTTTIVRRTRSHDTGLRDFLDLFNHRVVSLFYRCWEKYRIPIRFERSQRRGREPDDAEMALHSLVGLGTGGLRGRLAVPDRALLYYAGLFAQWPRNAVSLEALLSEFFELPVSVRQFHGEWLRLGLAERSRVPGDDEPLGRHNLLGRDTILGGHVWDVQGQFVIRVEPLTYLQFRSFMPTGDLLRPFCDLARAYVGPQLGFAVQPVLESREAPPCILGAWGDDPPLLGWNTWIHSEPIEERFAGVRFSLDQEISTG